jgi:tetratricopeptide (TPR) repeat protein
MLESRTRAHNCGLSEQLKRKRALHISALLIPAFLLMSFCALPQKAPAQVQPQGQIQGQENSIEAYANAIKKSTIADRITAMDHYLSIASGGSLKVDALEFLIWDHWRLGHEAQSVQRAQELLTITPGNSIALAVIYHDAATPSTGRNAIWIRLNALKSAMSNIDRLSKPEGMVERNFQMMKQQVAIMLTGETGLCYLALEDYPNAQVSLQRAVNNDPNNSQLVYGLALTLLSSKNRDQYRGYWYLARAANLTDGTAQGKQIGDYARNVYRKDGGKDAGWNRFLASAAALDAPPTPESGPAAKPTVSTASAANATTGKPANAAAPNRSNSASSQPTPASTPGPTTSASKTKNSSPIGKTKATGGFEDTLREPPADTASAAPVPPVNRPKIIAAPSQAVSLGILIETSLLTGDNREAIISTLKEIVRSLRTNDEACILVFSDQLDFEQDLTADDKLLEDAISQIRPKPGKDLLPGIAFAAGHLKRIGKNPNRVLMVISDGRSTEANADTLMFRSQVTGVRIDCLGLKTGGENERALLQSVAAYSGGTATFASNPGEFRTAALQMTNNMGITVR